jgi:hypothetical protein
MSDELKQFLAQPENEKHLLRHFMSDPTPGGKFNPDLFPNTQALIEYITQNPALNCFVQSNGRFAFLYQTVENAFAGWTGISPRDKWPEHLLIPGERDGCSILSVHASDMEKTNEFCVITNPPLNGIYTVLTAFPGPYAPPLPIPALAPALQKESKQFWDRYVFLIVDKSDNSCIL